MLDLATRNRAGLMGPNHVATLDRLRASVLTDPLNVVSAEPILDLVMTDRNGAPFTGNLSRATIGGYRQNSKGVLVPTVVNEPVIDFDGDGAALGTGFYGAYTNLLLRSEELDNAVWTKTAATITANAAVAPDGATTMDGLIESATNAQHTMSQSTSKAASSITYTVAFFARAGLGRRVFFQIFGTAYAGGAQATFDPETGAFTAAAATYGTGFSGASANFIQISSGLYLVWLTATSDTTTNISYQANLANGGSISYLGDGVSGAYLWGFSLTATTFPVPYVPTTTATVVRNADIMLISGTDFADFFNPVEGTFFVDAIASRGTTGFSMAVQFSDNSYNNRTFSYYDEATQTLYGRTVVGGVIQATHTFAVSRGASFRSAYSYKADEFKFSVNGATALSDLAGSVPSALTKVNIGSDHAGISQWSEHIRRLIYWPKALTATELQRMTA
jgi:hypothetical protein